VERELPERWAGKRLADLSTPGEVTVVAVTRSGVVRLDFGDLVGQDGDIIHVMVTDTALERLNARLSGRTDVPRVFGPPEDAPIGLDQEVADADAAAGAADAATRSQA
jgi:hypothetical protein